MGVRIPVYTNKIRSRCAESSRSGNSNNVKIDPLDQIPTNRMRIYNKIYNINNKSRKRGRVKRM